MSAFIPVEHQQTMKERIMMAISHNHVLEVMTFSRFNKRLTIWVWLCETVKNGYVSTCFDDGCNNSETYTTGSA
jgi:hypothetical protein